MTGANKGIGKEVARQLAARGFQVFLGSRDEARGQKAVEELRASGLNDVHLILIDVSSDESVKLAAESLAKKVTSLDVLVNNAAIIAAGSKTVLEESLAELKETYEVNVFGALRTIVAFLELLKKSKSGAQIINVSSGIGSLSWRTDPSNILYNFPSLGYSSSKTALNHISISYAKAFSEFNIKVNVVCPGYTATDMSNHMGTQTVEVGASAIVNLAAIEGEAPTLTFSNKDGPIPW